MQVAALMNQSEVPFNILCVIHAGNAGMGADLVRWFARQGFDWLQFIPCFEPGSPHNVSPDQYGGFLCDAFDYWRRDGFGKVHIRDFEALLANHVGQPDSLCTYGRVCDHYLVVEHTGDVYPCDFFVGPQWKLGNLMDRPLEQFFTSEAYRRFAYQKDKVAACRACPWRSLCHGGCPKDRRNGGDIASPTPFCVAYKRFFAHATPKLNALAKRLESHK